MKIYAGIYSSESVGDLCDNCLDASLERNSTLESGKERQKNLVSNPFYFKYAGDTGYYFYCIF